MLSAVTVEKMIVVNDSSKESGFTFIELMMVIFMLAILVSIATLNYYGLQQQTREDITRADLRTVKASLKAYYIRNGQQYPETLQKLKDDGYLDELPQDDFSTTNSNYIYHPNADQTGFTLWSVGPDGRSGTKDDIIP